MCIFGTNDLSWIQKIDECICWSQEMNATGIWNARRASPGNWSRERSRRWRRAPTRFLSFFEEKNPQTGSGGAGRSKGGIPSTRPRRESPGSGRAASKASSTGDYFLFLVTMVTLFVRIKLKMRTSCSTASSACDLDLTITVSDHWGACDDQDHVDCPLISF